LERLAIAFNPIDDTSVIFGLTNLQRIWVHGVISDEQYAEFRAALPNTEIIN